MHAEQQFIIQKLMHRPGLTFNELWNKEVVSSAFAYHLKILCDDGFIERKDGAYYLTSHGKSYATYVDGESGKEEKFPLFGVIIVVYDHIKQKYLLLKRLKEPFYGYWGFHGGKIKFNQYILECAADELHEETGLHCDVELKGVFSSKTYNNGQLSYNHQLFVVYATNPSGVLIESTREGINEWFSADEITSLHTFPNVPLSINIVTSTRFRWVEADRFQENDVFKEIKILKNKEY